MIKLLLDQNRDEAINCIERPFVVLVDDEILLHFMLLLHHEALSCEDWVN